MVLIGAPSPAVVQCANALFLAAAIVQDVLVIRLLLSGAFICLIVDACRLAQETGVLQLDFLAWGVLTGMVHWFYAYRLAARQRRRGAERAPLAAPKPDGASRPPRRSAEREPLAAPKPDDGAPV